MILYGISNCDTVRKARKWLSERNVDHQYHDFRKDGLDQQTVKNWLDSVGMDVLLNKRGTTWRKLPEEEKTDLSDQRLIQLLVDNPTLIKRPVLITDQQILVGFKEADYLSLIN